MLIFYRIKDYDNQVDVIEPEFRSFSANSKNYELLQLAVIRNNSEKAILLKHQIQLDGVIESGVEVLTIKQINQCKTEHSKPLVVDALTDQIFFIPLTNSAKTGIEKIIQKGLLANSISTQIPFRRRSPVWNIRNGRETSRIFRRS